MVFDGLNLLAKRLQIFFLDCDIHIYTYYFVTISYIHIYIYMLYIYICLYDISWDGPWSSGLVPEAFNLQDLGFETKPSIATIASSEGFRIAK